MKDECARCQKPTRQVKAGKNRSGSQRWQCLECKRYRTPAPNEHGHAPSVRQQAMRCLVEGVSQRKTARLVGASPQSVANWLALATRTLQEQHPPEVPEEVAVPGDLIVEMDEVYTFVNAKREKKGNKR